MDIKKTINHPSMQREFGMFRAIGGKITIKGNKIILKPHIVPRNTAKIFVQRIKKRDPEDLLEVILF